MPDGRGLGERTEGLEICSSFFVGNARAGAMSTGVGTATLESNECLTGRVKRDKERTKIHGVVL